MDVDVDVDVGVGEHRVCLRRHALVSSYPVRAGRMAVVSGEGPAEGGVGLVASGACRGVHARAAGQQFGCVV